MYIHTHICIYIYIYIYIINSFQTTLPPNTEELYKHYSVITQDEPCFERSNCQCKHYSLLSFSMCFSL